MNRRVGGVDAGPLPVGGADAGPLPVGGADAGPLPGAPDGAGLEEVARRHGVELRRGEPLAGHTTMRVGGPADLFARTGTTAALIELVAAARAGHVPIHILGRGSDVVVADAGIRGFVVLSRAEGYRIDGNLLTAEAGLPLARAATLAERAGLSGLEFGLAIPGTVGGAVWANAGAHGSDVAGVLESVTVLLQDGGQATRPASELGLSYRDSRFKGTDAVGPGDPPPAELVLTATFRLSPADPAAIKARLDDIRRWRREHQPLSQPSAGSVFRNPAGESAGRLVDLCGLRGRRLGGAAISEKHANFIVNEGGATASDVRRLAELARAAVAERFGVELEFEVKFVGDWAGWPEDPAR